MNAIAFRTSFDDTYPIADRNVVCSTGRQFEDPIRPCAGDPEPRAESFDAFDSAGDQPDRVDGKRDEHHVKRPGSGSRELEEEGVPLGDGTPEHQSSSPGGKRVGHLDSGREDRIRIAVDETHGRR